MFGAIIVGMNKEKIIIITLLIIGLFGAFSLGYLDSNIGAMMWGNNNEKEFSKPIDVVWRGEIISIMSGGSCLGMKGEFDDYDLAMVCLPDVDSGGLWKFEGVVTVTGKWLGITCAYKNTIFGECVPDIRIENIQIDSSN